METQRDIAQASIDRTLRLMIAISRDGGSVPLNAQAGRLGIPLSTAYRLARQLSLHGLVAPAARGHFGPGLVLAEITTTPSGEILAAAARAPMRKLARSRRATAHLGVFDGEMVTYLVKEHGGGPRLFTREGSQLEAYCSGLGKILLAASDEQRLESYLSTGPFIALTASTKVDPAAIHRDIDDARAWGYAIDDREVAEDVRCIAVPVRGRSGDVIAALSLSSPADRVDAETVLAGLRGCAAQIEARLGCCSDPAAVMAR